MSDDELSLTEQYQAATLEQLERMTKELEQARSRLTVLVVVALLPFAVILLAVLAGVTVGISA